MAVESIDVMNQGRGGEVCTGGAVGGVQFGGLKDLIGIQTGDFTDLIQRILFHQGFVLLKAIGVFLHIVHIGPAVIDDQLCHAQRQRTVGAGPDLEENIRQILGGRSIPNVNDDDLAAAFFQLLHTCDRQMIGIVAFVVPTQKRIGMSHIRRAAAAGGDLVGDIHGREAGAVIRSEVDTSEHMGETMENGAIPLAVAAEKRNGVRGIGLLDCV